LINIRINFTVDLSEKVIEELLRKAINEGLIFKDPNKSPVDQIKELFMWEGIKVYEELMEECLTNSVTSS
jgi:hypothetical protein